MAARCGTHARTALAQSPPIGAHTRVPARFMLGMLSAANIQSSPLLQDAALRSRGGVPDVSRLSAVPTFTLSGRTPFGLDILALAALTDHTGPAPTIRSGDPEMRGLHSPRHSIHLPLCLQRRSKSSWKRANSRWTSGPRNPSPQTPAMPPAVPTSHR